MRNSVIDFSAQLWFSKDTTKFLLFDCSAKIAIRYITIVPIRINVHLDESSLTAGSVVYSSDLGSALEECSFLFGKGLLGVFLWTSTRCPVWRGWGSLAVGALYPFLLSLKDY